MRDLGLGTGSDELLDKAAAAKAVSIVIARASTESRNGALRAIARAIRMRESQLLAANTQDCARAPEGTELDRLRLTPERIAGMAHDVEAIAALDDPVGQEFDRTSRPNGLEISKRRVPLGVVGVVYESRPNVTSDIAALCLKTETPWCCVEGKRR